MRKMTQTFLAAVALLCFVSNPLQAASVVPDTASGPNNPSATIDGISGNYALLYTGQTISWSFNSPQSLGGFVILDPYRETSTDFLGSFNLSLFSGSALLFSTDYKASKRGSCDFDCSPEQSLFRSRFGFDQIYDGVTGADFTLLSSYDVTNPAYGGGSGSGGLGDIEFRTEVVPVPASLVFAASGLALLVGSGFSRRKQTDGAKNP